MKKIKIFLSILNHLIVPAYIVGVWIFFLEITTERSYLNTGVWGLEFILIGIAESIILLAFLIKIKKYLLEKEKNNIANECDKEGVSGLIKGERVDSAEISRLLNERSWIAIKQVFLMILLDAIFIPLKLKNEVALEYFYYTASIFLAICLLEWGLHRIINNKKYDRHWKKEKCRKGSRDSVHPKKEEGEESKFRKEVFNSKSVIHSSDQEAGEKILNTLAEKRAKRYTK